MKEEGMGDRGEWRR